jgi:hypothetical protein
VTDTSEASSFSCKIPPGNERLPARSSSADKCKRDKRTTWISLRRFFPHLPLSIPSANAGKNPRIWKSLNAYTYPKTEPQKRGTVGVDDLNRAVFRELNKKADTLGSERGRTLVGRHVWPDRSVTTHRRWRSERNTWRSLASSPFAFLRRRSHLSPCV